MLVAPTSREEWLWESAGKAVLLPDDASPSRRATGRVNAFWDKEHSCGSRGNLGPIDTQGHVENTGHCNDPKLNILWSINIHSRIRNAESCVNLLITNFSPNGFLNKDFRHIGDLPFGNLKKDNAHTLKNGIQMVITTVTYVTDWWQSILLGYLLILQWGKGYACQEARQSSIVFYIDSYQIIQLRSPFYQPQLPQTTLNVRPMVSNSYL